jgi:hypothetical protein
MLKLIKQDQIDCPGLDPKSRAKKWLREVTKYYQSQKNLIQRRLK